MVSWPLPPMVPLVYVWLVPVRLISALSLGVPPSKLRVAMLRVAGMLSVSVPPDMVMLPTAGAERSEERRVGKEWRWRGSPEHAVKKNVVAPLLVVAPVTLYVP